MALKGWHWLARTILILPGLAVEAAACGWPWWMLGLAVAAGYGVTFIVWPPRRCTGADSL